MKKYILAALLTAIAPPAFAQCELTIPSMGALRYNTFDTMDQVILMSGTVTCDMTTTVRIQASKGSSNTYNQRTFASGQNRLNYNVYLGTSETYIWGDRSAGTSEMRFMVNNATATPITANVRIPAGQNPPVGVYSDTLVFTLIF